MGTDRGCFISCIIVCCALYLLMVAIGATLFVQFSQHLVEVLPSFSSQLFSVQLSFLLKLPFFSSPFSFRFSLAFLPLFEYSPALCCFFSRSFFLKLFSFLLLLFFFASIITMASETCKVFISYVLPFTSIFYVDLHSYQII